MKVIRPLLFLCCLVFSLAKVSAQELQPYSHYQYQRLSRLAYAPGAKIHTANKPFVNADTAWFKGLDSLYKNVQMPNATKWIPRKLFNEHLVEVRNPDYHFYLDYLPDIVPGRDIDNDLNTLVWMKGLQLGGQVKNKVSFYVSLFEGQTKFNRYITDFVDNNGIIPGMVNDKKAASANKSQEKDYSYATALLNYTPNKYLSFTLGHDRNFIGDGYRSMLMSDVSAAYPFFKVQANLGSVQYSAMWAQFQDLRAPKLSAQHGYRKKWGVFHFLDWNVTSDLSLGFFDAIIWQDADENGKRGFDFAYLNPLAFLRPAESMNGSPDNALIGFTAKYKIGNGIVPYAQLLLDEFVFKNMTSGNGSWTNKLAYQIGFRGYDFLKVRNLNYLFEVNAARPFTYSHRLSTMNYGHYNQALAHPMGANFKEFVTIWNYERARWVFQLQLNSATYGLDNGENVGQDIWRSYNERSRNEGFKIGDGLKTTYNFAEAKLAYVINPNYNLRIELGGLMREAKNEINTQKTTEFSIGLRSSFRNIYKDF
ncbi:MAG: gliding motility protein RemB [Pedobacter sp.]|nr:MAG: gliding motility protein RemB [Pedobacter sp.]